MWPTWRPGKLSWNVLETHGLPEIFFWVTIFEAWAPQLENFHYMLKFSSRRGYMRKLHRCEFHTGMTFWFFDGSSHISGILKVHFMLIHVHFKSQTLCIPYPFQSTCRPINTKTGGHFTFTWYRYEIFYLTPLQQREWTHFGVTRTGMAFSGGIMYFKTNEEPWKGTRVNSDRRESRPGVM